MESKFILEPFKGVRLVNFGMSQPEVNYILGKPDFQKNDDVMREILEKRANIEFCYKHRDNNHLSDLTFFKGSSLIFKNIDLMNTSGALELLQKEFPDFEDIKGHFNFSRLGVLLCGFGRKKIPEGKYIIVYGKTRISFFEGYGAY